MPAISSINDRPASPIQRREQRGTDPHQYVIEFCDLSPVGFSRSWRFAVHGGDWRFDPKRDGPWRSASVTPSCRFIDLDTIPARSVLIGKKDQNRRRRFRGAFAPRIVQQQQGVIYITGSELQPTTWATSVRKRDGKRLLTDGPLWRCARPLAGITSCEAKDLDEPVALRSEFRQDGSALSRFDRWCKRAAQAPA